MQLSFPHPGLTIAAGSLHPLQPLGLALEWAAVSSSPLPLVADVLPAVPTETWNIFVHLKALHIFQGHFYKLKITLYIFLKHY